MSGTDPFVILEGGIVANDPTVPVLDLDVFTDEVGDADDVTHLRDRVLDIIAESGPTTALTAIVERCEQWLDANTASSTDHS